MMTRPNDQLKTEDISFNNLSYLCMFYEIYDWGPSNKCDDFLVVFQMLAINQFTQFTVEQAGVIFHLQKLRLSYIGQKVKVNPCAT